jgi:hypothetical protein
MNHMAVIGARAGHSSAHFAEAREFADPSAAQQSLYSVYFHEYADKSPLLIRLQGCEGIAGAQPCSHSAIRFFYGLHKNFRPCNSVLPVHTASGWTTLNPRGC